MQKDQLACRLQSIANSLVAFGLLKLIRAVEELTFSYSADVLNRSKLFRFTYIREKSRTSIVFSVSVHRYHHHQPVREIEEALYQVMYKREYKPPSKHCESN